MAATKFFKGDTIQVKLSDADWQSAIVLAREVTGHGTPARSVSYYVALASGLNVMVHSSNAK